jgi:hypothetical protein
MAKIDPQNVLTEKEASYLRTIIDAAADELAKTKSNPGIVDGLRVCGCIVRGYTLDAAKQQVYVTLPKLLANGGKLR